LGALLLMLTVSIAPRAMINIGGEKALFWRVATLLCAALPADHHN
jgi:hypothetical protein